MLPPPISHLLVEHFREPPRRPKPINGRTYALSLSALEIPTSTEARRGLLPDSGMRALQPGQASESMMFSRTWNPRRLTSNLPHSGQNVLSRSPRLSGRFQYKRT